MRVKERYFITAILLVMITTATIGRAHSCTGDDNVMTHRKFCYPAFFRQFSPKRKQHTAVVVIGYNRPHYFKKLLNSLSTNPESTYLPFFFILDGGPQARQEEYVALINSAPIKHKYVIRRPFHYGLHWNIIAGLRFMFDWCGFKRIVHFEEDIIVTPTYLGLVLSCDVWAHNTYSNIGAVQAYHPCRMSLHEKKKNLDLVGETANYWLGYCMRKSVWDAIKAIPYEYENLFLKGKRWTPDRIQIWMRAKMNKGRVIHETDPAKKQWSIPLHPYYMNMPEMGGTQGQCGILTMSLFLRGYSRLSTLVNRAINIGKEGTHYTPSQWEKHFTGITLDAFSEDRNLKSFRPFQAFIH